MPTGALFAWGTLLKIDDGAGNYTTIAEVTTISGAELTLDILEATNHNTSTLGYKEKIGGLLDAGTVTFSINYIPTSGTHNVTTGLLRDMKNRTLRNFKLVMSDSGATTWVLPALVQKFSPKFPVDNKISADVTLAISGVPTLV